MLQLKTSVPQYVVTDEEAEKYFNWVVLSVETKIQKLFFRCIRVARKLSRKLNITFIYRFMFEKFDAWMLAHKDGTVCEFLEMSSVRDIFQGISYNYAERRHYYEKVFGATLQ